MSCSIDISALQNLKKQFQQKKEVKNTIKKPKQIQVGLPKVESGIQSISKKAQRTDLSDLTELKQLKQNITGIKKINPQSNQSENYNNLALKLDQAQKIVQQLKIKQHRKTIKPTVQVPTKSNKNNRSRQKKSFLDLQHIYDEFYRELDLLQVAWHARQKINHLLRKHFFTTIDNQYRNLKTVKEKAQFLVDKLPVEKYTKIIELLTLGKEQFAARQNKLGPLTYPEELPITSKISDIQQAIQSNQVIIVVGHTGSGKTTQLPKICLEMGLGCGGLIANTQPRRIAARSVSSRIQEEINLSANFKNSENIVGFKVRFNDQTKPDNQIKVMTDGVLLAEISQSPLLEQYSCIILDEAHERSLNNDFLLGYIKHILPNRPDLKLIITSATIDVNRFSQHFDNAPIIEVEGNTYPVEIQYAPLERLTHFDDKGNITATIDLDQIDHLANCINRLHQNSLGDILIFVSGEKEIHDLTDELNKLYPQIQVLPLFAMLSQDKQQKIFKPDGTLRIIISTNIAETSLTVPGIKYVIDYGQARISRYNYRSQVQRLPIEAISKASANQRSGRCGRTSPGIAIRLYSENDFQARTEFTEPEILRTNLASVILQMYSLKLPDIFEFPFIDKPDPKLMRDGIKLLLQLGALQQDKDNNFHLTNTGKLMSSFPIDPRLAKILIQASESNSLSQALIIVSFLTIVDPRERPNDRQMQSDQAHAKYRDKQSDFVTIINLWNFINEQRQELSATGFRKFCRDNFLNYLRIREWQDLHYQIKQLATEYKLKLNSLEPSYQELHIPIISANLSFIGQKNSKARGEYLGALSRKFKIFPSSGVFRTQPSWIVASEIIETSQLFARLVCSILPEWIEPLAKHLLKQSYSDAFWSGTRQEVMAHMKLSLYGLTIVEKRIVPYSDIDPMACRDLFITGALIDGEWTGNYPFVKHNNKLLDDLEQLEIQQRRRDLIIDSDTLYHYYQQVIPENVINTKSFDLWYKSNPDQINALLRFSDDDLLLQDVEKFSKYFKSASQKLKLEYTFDHNSNQDGVSVYVPIEILNSLDPAEFTWHIDHYRHELVTSLIKSLSKDKRTKLVPATNSAQLFIDHINKYRAEKGELPKGSLAHNMTIFFNRLLGSNDLLNINDWDYKSLDTHLKMHFKVIAIAGSLIKSSDDLQSLQLELQYNSNNTIAELLKDEVTHFTQEQAQTWKFGNIAHKITKRIKNKNKNVEITAFPALVDMKDHVGIELFSSQAEQQSKMHQALIRLVVLQANSTIKYLQHNLPNKSKLALYFNPYSTVDYLINSVIELAAGNLINKFNFKYKEWNENNFAKLLDFTLGNLNDETIEITKLLEEILTLGYRIRSKIKSLSGLIDRDSKLLLQVSDIKSHLDSLIFKDFVHKFNVHQLQQIPRYLNGIIYRLNKIQSNSSDFQKQQQINELNNRYKLLISKWPVNKPIEALDEIFFMLQELRVSLFAQSLGVPYSVSTNKVAQKLDEYEIK